MITRIIATTLSVLWIAAPVWAIEAPAASAAANVSSTSQMQTGKRFHKTHVTKAKLACDTCHSPSNEDALRVRVREAPGMPGAVNREACIGCHQAPAKPTWYGPAK